MRRILLLDDEKNVLAALTRSIKQLYAISELVIESFSDAKPAIERIAMVDFDFVVSDYHMPGMNGIDFLRIVKELRPDTIRLMLSASADFRTVMDAVNEAEVFRYIPKPWIADELKEIIEIATHHRTQIIEDKRLAEQRREQLNPVSPEEREIRLLEDIEPGITKVNWEPDGSIKID